MDAIGGIERAERTEAQSKIKIAEVLGNGGMERWIKGEPGSRRGECEIGGYDVAIAGLGWR